MEQLNLMRISHDRLTREATRYTSRLWCQATPPGRTCKPSLTIPSPRSASHMAWRVLRIIKRVLAKIHAYDQSISEEAQTVLSVEAQAVARIMLVKLE